jgi:hypothetical protein
VVAAAAGVAAGAAASEVAAAAGLLAAEAAAGSLAAEVAVAAESGSGSVACGSVPARVARLAPVARAAACPGERAACAKSQARCRRSADHFRPNNQTNSVSAATSQKYQQRASSDLCLPEFRLHLSRWHVSKTPERTNSRLAAAGVNDRGRSAAFPWLRPVLVDRCRTPRGCLPTMRVRLRG